MKIIYKINWNKTEKNNVNQMNQSPKIILNILNSKEKKLNDKNWSTHIERERQSDSKQIVLLTIFVTCFL